MGTVFEKLGFGSSMGIDIFNSLCESLRQKRNAEKDRSRSLSDAEALTLLEDGTVPGADTETPKASSEPDRPAPSSSLYSTVASAVGAVAAGLGAVTATEAKSETSENKMDLDDFIETASEIDEVLIQAIQMINRRRMKTVLQGSS